MKILITGARGMIGSRLQDLLRSKGHELLLASRRDAMSSNEVQWSTENGFDELERLEGLDAVIHLAGESISGFRWTDEKKKAIRDSRVVGTRSVVDALAGLQKKPQVVISGSATGFYGDRGDDVMDESSPPGNNFLADVCKEWEAETLRAETLGIRTVLLRTGIVLMKDGGALSTMLTPFKLGVGGVVGSGKQWMSWISIDDEVGIINFVLENQDVSGPVNAVAPNPVTNEEFTKTLGEAIHRPTVLPLPAFGVKILFGEMGDELLLGSTRVVPKRLQELGYQFKYTHLKPAIVDALS